MDGNRIVGALEAGAASGWFAGCQAAFLDAGGTRLFSSGREGGESSGIVSDATLFDLASLTKPLVALSLLEKIERGEIPLDRSVGQTLPDLADGPLAGIVISSLLGHRSGLPPFRHWEREFAPHEEGEVLARIVRGEGRAFARERLCALVPQPDAGVVYSDIGYFLLQLLLEEGYGFGLPSLIAKGAVTEECGLTYLPVGAAVPPAVARSGWCDWRGRFPKGEVNDPRAYLVGGVAAWAGLFGTAAGLAGVAGRVISLWKRGGPGAGALRLLAEGDAGTRAGGFGYGFMLPTPGKSLGGASIAPSAFGHVGFTGTSLWIDPRGGRAAILLTNLHLPPEERAGFNRWRRDLHDLFWKET